MHDVHSQASVNSGDKSEICFDVYLWDPLDFLFFVVFF
jgi:hypothetical protein